MKKILFFISFLILFKAQATHIVGGEIMYQYVSKNSSTAKYKITLFLYIDCINGQPGAIQEDNIGFINVFETQTQILRTNLCRSVQRTGPVRVSDVNYKCIKTIPNACVDKYSYETEIDFPLSVKSYTITFERCCRNNSIKNIVLPLDAGATYWTEIQDVSKGNSSPFFKALPPNFLCTNAPLKFDHSAYDKDGDSLVYELYQPFNGAYQENVNKPRPDFNNFDNLPIFPDKFNRLVTWESGYDTYLNQIDGNPTLMINRFTGKLTLTPIATGQYVIGIKVLEYRNGKLIGETKRDFQFNVDNCVFDVVSSFGVPYTNCTGNQISFQNRSQGASQYFWDFGVDAITTDTSTMKNPTYLFDNPGYYTIRLIAWANICIDTSEFQIFVKKNFVTKSSNDTLICGPFTKVLKTNTPNKTYQWNTGEKTPSITVNKGGQYIVTVTDLPCISRDTINIVNDLSLIDIGPDSVICRDSFVQFTYQGPAGYKSYLWNDRTTQSSVFISQLGKYWVDAVNKNNCPSNDSITFVLYPPPRVNLFDTLFCRGTTVVLDGVNYSIKTKLETTYQWNTGEKTPQIVAGTPGMYIVKVRNKLCTIIDTAIIDYIITGLELGNDTFYCGPVDRWLIPKQDYVKYLWHDFAEVKSYYANSPGKKKLTITTKEGCVESDSVMLSQFPGLDGGLGNDTTVCLSAKVVLTAADSMVTYKWNTGETTQSIVVKDQGTYFVTVKNINGCIVTDTIHIREDANALPSEMFMPNAFTPNDDGTNEFYPGNNYSDPGSDYMIRLYNRWGEKVFESETPSVQWDGTYKGEPVPQDVYVFYVKYIACDEKEHWFRGTFTLMR